MTRRKKILFLLAGAAAFGFGFLSTLRSAPAAERFDMKVRDDFFAGFNGNREALDRAMKVCESQLAADPKHAEALVWHGAGLYFLGGQAFMSGDADKGMDLVTKGIAEMEQAVQMAPDNVAVRIPRGSVLLQSTLRMGDDVPVRQQLTEAGLSDFMRTYELQKEHFDGLSTHSKGELMFGIADANRRLGQTADAEKWFRRISTELSGSIYQKRADKYLATKTLAVEDATCAGCHASK